MRGRTKLGSRKSTLWPIGSSMCSLVLWIQACPFLPTGTEFPVAEVVVMAEPASFQLGGTAQAWVTLKDAYGNVLTDIEVSWSSSDAAVATVSPNGGTAAVVTGVGDGTSTITASVQGESGSTVVEVTPTESPPPAVHTVAVVLASTELTAGETTTATATLRDASGAELGGRTVSWSSTDEDVATVSGDGETSAVVTAVAEGSADIIATAEGESGHTSVTVATGDAAPAAYPNQPAAFSVATDRPFSLLTEDGWSATDFIENGFTVTVDLTAPRSSAGVGQMFYPEGHPGGYETGKTSRTIAGLGYTRLYVSFWVKLSSNWYGHPVVNKLGYIWTHEKPVVFPSYVGGGSAPLSTEVRIQDAAGHGGAENFTPNLADPEIRRGEWVRWEILLVNNTGDEADGQIHWWIDGEKVGEYRKVHFSSSSQPKEWEAVKWDPIWGGRDSTVPYDMYMWMDHYYASGAP